MENDLEMCEENIQGNEIEVEKPEFYIMETETGEVVDVHIGDSIYVITKEQKEYFFNTIEINTNKKFTLIYEGALRIMSQLKLTSNARAIFEVMVSHLGWHSFGGYVVRSRNNRFYGFMNKKELMEETHIKESTFDEAIKQLVEHKIIAKQKEDHNTIYIVNPFIASHDERVSKELFEVFQDSIFNYNHETLSHNNSNENCENLLLKME